MQVVKEITTTKFKLALLGIYKLKVTDTFKVFLEGETSVLFLLLSNMSEIFTPSQIAEKLQVTKGRVTVMLNSLLDKGFIEMNVSKEDRRKYEVSLTKEGIEEISTYMNEADSKVDEILNRLGEEKASELVEILNLIISNSEVN